MKKKKRQNRIYELRKNRKMTLAQLGEAMDTSAAQAHRLENSDRSLSLDWMRRLSKAFNCKPEELFLEEDRKMNSGEDLPALILELDKEDQDAIERFVKGLLAKKLANKE